ncbi:MAG: hypothetical protein GY797_35265 [Deltaproteobacteria bacterium]|nr:hypothetical protein [Deltaproteobacteria bacterium]
MLKRKRGLTIKMHANWQAVHFLELAGPVTVSRQQNSVADFANRVILGRWVVSLETENEKLTGLVFCFFVGFPIG